MNSLNWIYRERIGVVGSGLLSKAPIMHNISSCNPTIHGVALHMHLSNHSIIVISCCLS